MIRYLLLSWLSLPSAKAFVSTGNCVNGRVRTLLEAHRKQTREHCVVSKNAAACALVGVVCVGVASGVPNIQPAVAAYSQTVSESELHTPAIST
jgi:hypothetical protein